jgi:uncharacterized sporulation protein YeaH/YhbH (DUF444 family)
MKMEADLNRFRRILQGKIKDGLRKFIANGELVARQGKQSVSIPLPRIELPQFIFGSNDDKGVGQGQGQVGDELSEGTPEERQAGDGSAEHTLEVDVSLEELSQLLSEVLSLPNIENKGKKNINSESARYTGIQKHGPESLHHFRKTYKEALKRSISSGDYNPLDPIVTPIKEDKRYRAISLTKSPVANAVIIYMMDVSGSMGDEQKEVVRLTSFWLDTWLSQQYKGLERRYVIHDASAKEVDHATFFKTKESGGTLISSAYKLVKNMVEEKFHPSQWNIYLFHFSDGDNWSGNDTTECMKIMEESLLPASNLFCYGQVESRYGSGQFLRDLTKHFGTDDDKVVTAQIKDKEAIMDALKTFLGRGK